MNDTSLERYCNVLYEFFCYRVTWFFCWRQQFFSNFRYFACGMIRRHLMPFHKMSKFKSGIAPHVMVHILTKFGSDWAIFYLFISSNVHSFFSSSLVVSDHQSLNCYNFWTTYSFYINDPSLESYDVAAYGFLCLYQAMHVFVSRTFIYI